MADEAHQEEQEPQLQRLQSAKPLQIKHIDEDQPVRHKFHRCSKHLLYFDHVLLPVHSCDVLQTRWFAFCRRMMQAAANGQASDVSEILDEMQEDGLEPGPYAYHALVFAHVKNKDSDEALAVMKLMHKLGMYNHRADSQFFCRCILVCGPSKHRTAWHVVLRRAAGCGAELLCSDL